MGLPPVAIVDVYYRICFYHAVPYGFGKVSGKAFDWVVEESVGIDTIVLLSCYW